jgi:hypothetical protein
VDWCEEDGQACLQTADGRFCEWRGQNQCPEGFEPGCDPGNECIDLPDGQACQRVNQPRCPEGFELENDGCGNRPADECFELDENGLVCVWRGEPQGCPAGYDEVDWCEEDGQACIQTAEGRFCEWRGQQNQCPEGFEPGCDPMRNGECIQLDNGEVCQQVEPPRPECQQGHMEIEGPDQCLQDDAVCYEIEDGRWCTGPDGRENLCPDGFDLTDVPCDADSPNECFPVADGLYCQWQR